jgi:hypothetical protein
MTKEEYITLLNENTPKAFTEDGIYLPQSLFNMHRADIQAKAKEAGVSEKELETIEAEWNALFKALDGDEYWSGDRVRLLTGTLYLVNVTLALYNGKTIIHLNYDADPLPSKREMSNGIFVRTPELEFPLNDPRFSATVGNTMSRKPDYVYGMCKAYTITLTK